MAQNVIAVIGAGGKTTAMKQLAKQAGTSSVLVTTTTHIYPFEPSECRLCLTDPQTQTLIRELEFPGILCVGTTSTEGKLGCLPTPVLASAINSADVVMYEADGAHGHPLKIHRRDEPVILPETTQCLVVAGLSCLGQKVSGVIHRYALNPAWKEQPEKTVDVRDVFYCIMETIDACGLPDENIRVFLNQADQLPNQEAVRELEQKLADQGLIFRSGSLRRPPEDLYRWITG